MTSYRHKLLSSYGYLLIVWTTFLPLDAANSADTLQAHQPDTSRSALNALAGPRVHRKTGNNLGQEGHVLLSSRNI